MAYKKVIVDCSNATATKVQVVPQGQRIAEVFALTFPTGANFRLYFGQGDDIYIDKPFSFAPRGTDETDHGLFYTVDAAQPGLSVEVTVGFAEPGA